MAAILRIPFFEVNHLGSTYQFGNCYTDIEPRFMENRYEYTYTALHHPGELHHVALTDNTILAALQAMLDIPIDPTRFRFHWNVPPSVQDDLVDEGWTVEGVLESLIGNHPALRIELL